MKAFAVLSMLALSACWPPEEEDFDVPVEGSLGMERDGSQWTIMPRWESQLVTRIKKVD